MITDIHDDKDGIIIQFSLEDGLALGIKMSDEQAQKFINIIQNKINTRLV